MPKCSNLVYSSLIQCENSLIPRKNRWEHKLNISIEMSEFLKHFKAIYQTTIATKYRDFQYRLLIGNIITNRLLFLWKKSDTQMCSFCKLYIEDEIHLFCECNRIKTVWTDTRRYIRDNDMQNVYNMLTWDNCSIIWSMVHPKRSHAINLIVTVVKQFIYRARCLNNMFMLTNGSIIEEIDSIYNIKYNIAKTKNKLRRHAEKWSSLKDIDITDDFVQQYIDNI